MMELYRVTEKEAKTNSNQPAQISRCANDWPLWPKIRFGVSMAMETPLIIPGAT